MRIAFVWDWPLEFSQAITWKDGLAAAIKLLRIRHELEVFACSDVDIDVPHDYFPIRGRSDVAEAVKAFIPDVILVWGDTTRPNAPALAAIGKPMLACFAGGNTSGEMAQYFQHFFVESAEYFDRFEAQGDSVSRAFGVNTSLFNPNHPMLKDQQKVFDVYNSSTFCDWKRQPLLAEATRGLKVAMSGYMYPDHEMDCWNIPQKNGNLVLPHLSASGVASMMKASRCVVLPSRADGGSQRSVLEAMAMDVPVIVAEDSKGAEYVRECGWTSLVVKPEAEQLRYWIDQVVQGHIQPKGGRDYVLGKYTEHHYADALEAGLLALC